MLYRKGQTDTQTDTQADTQADTDEHVTPATAVGASSDDDDNTFYQLL